MADTAIITGASQGIGKATALLFAKKGYNLVLAARQIERLEAVAEEVRDLGCQAIAHSTNVKDPEQVNTLIQTALSHYSSIDVLINNAGVYLLGSVESCDLNDWHQVIDTNLWGYIHMINALLPHFLEREKGTIINISSIGGKIPISYQVPYITSKYAVTGLTESLHAELLPKGIHVSGIYPNFIKSDLMERAIFRGKNEQDAQDRRQLLEKALAVPVIEKPEDVAKAIWDAVVHQKIEVMVGSANFSKSVYRLVPGVMQGLFRKVFASKEKLV
jgi:NADP-dependent 3-hydroxy acid dehydrogenase YdfG